MNQKEKKKINMSTHLYKTIQIPTIIDEASLTFAEAKRHIPFQIKRFYLIYNADTNNIRGKHAHRRLKQVIFCIRGSIRMVLDNGSRREEVLLDNPHTGLLLENMVWREMHGFTKDTILFVVASEYFEERDYIREYDEFIAIAKSRKRFPEILISLWGFIERRLIWPYQRIQERQAFARK